MTTNAPSTPVLPRWTVQTSATPEQYRKALTDLTDAIPSWIGHMQQRRIHHSESENRVQDNTILSSILLMENDTLRLRQRPQRYLRNILHGTTRQYLDGLNELVDRLVDLSDALFAPPDDRIICPCWFDHAVIPGSETVLLQQLYDAWKNHYERLMDEEPELVKPFYYSWPTKLNIDSIPHRIPIRHANGTRQGWDNVTLQLEPGYQAILQIARVKRVGHDILAALPEA